MNSRRKFITGLLALGSTTMVPFKQKLVGVVVPQIPGIDESGA